MRGLGIGFPRGLSDVASAWNTATTLGLGICRSHVYYDI